MKKIILIIICSIITFIVVGIGCMFWIVNANGAKNNDNPVYAAQISSVLQEYVKGVDNFGKARVICYCVGNNPEDDELKKFDDLFDKKIDGSFKIVKSKFDSDKDIPIEKVSKVID